MSRHLKIYAKAPANYETLKEEVQEKASCSVIALSAITHLPLEAVRLALTKAGRKKGQGAKRDVIEKALKLLGYDAIKMPRALYRGIINGYPGRHSNLSKITTHHPRRFPGAWAGKPDMLFLCPKHVCAFVNGEVADWTIQHSCHVEEIWTIKKVANMAGIEKVHAKKGGE